MKGFVLILSVIVIIVSCQKHETMIVRPLNGNTAKTNKELNFKDPISSFVLDETNVLKIHVPQKETRFSIDNYISTCEYIPLETRKDNLIGSINKICVDSSFVFIFDKENNNVFHFSNKGKYLGKIGSVGRGPEEYVSLSDISLDNVHKEICLLDLGGGKLIYFDYSGKYRREEAIYYYHSNMEFLENKIVQSTGLSYNNNIPTIDLNRLLLCKRNQQPVRKSFSYTAELRERFHWGREHPLTKFGKDIYFNHILSDTIWQVYENRCVARYLVKFWSRDNLFNPEEIKTISDEEYSAKIKNRQYFYGTFLMTNDFIYLDIVNENGYVNPLIYCKSSGNILYGSFISHSSENSLTANLFQSSFDFIFDEKSFVKVIRPFWVLRSIKKMKEINSLPTLADREKSLIENMNEEDNPVLVIVTLKHF